MDSRKSGFWARKPCTVARDPPTAHTHPAAAYRSASHTSDCGVRVPTQLGWRQPWSAQSCRYRRLHPVALKLVAVGRADQCAIDAEGAAHTIRRLRQTDRSAANAPQSLPRARPKVGRVNGWFRSCRGSQKNMMCDLQRARSAPLLAWICQLRCGVLAPWRIEGRDRSILARKRIGNGRSSTVPICSPPANSRL